MTSGIARTLTALTAGLAVLTLAACGGGGMSSTAVSPSSTPMQPADMSASSSAVRVPAELRGMDADLNANDGGRNDDGEAVLPRLRTQTTIGSTVDPLNGDQNPYGLDVAPVTAGLLHKGDLVIQPGTISPTGKEMHAPCCDVFRLKDGKVFSFHCYVAVPILLEQLGIFMNLQAAIKR